jgi:beta-lactamase superfamily II metal-dependent hydrolase
MAKSACLEIHQLNVGAGDSALVINRDLDVTYDVILASGKITKKQLDALDEIHYVPFASKNSIPLPGTVKKALLVDGGDDEFGKDVYSYLVSQGAIDTKKVKQDNLAVLVSHYHEDHVAGLRYIIRDRKDAHSPEKRRRCPATVYQANTTVWVGDVCTEWRKWVSEDVAKKFTKLVEVYPGGVDINGKPVTFDLGTGYNDMAITVTLVASGEQVRMNKKGKLKLDAVKVKVKAKGKFDPNDRSIVAVLQYGSFRFFLGGDIAGNGRDGGGNVSTLAMGKPKSHASGQHGDAETPVGQALENLFEETAKATAGQPKFPNAGYCTVLKADHHGSSSSNDVFFFGTLQPLVFLNSSGLRPRPHGHPTQQVIDRASATGLGTPWLLRPVGNTDSVGNTIQGLYVTEIAQKWVERLTGKKPPSRKTRSVTMRGARIVGDIVVRPIDGTVDTIQKATTFNKKLTVQVFGTRAQLDLPDLIKRVGKKWTNDFVLFPLTKAKASPDPGKPASDCYTLGPWEHSDTH